MLSGQAFTVSLQVIFLLYAASVSAQTLLRPQEAEKADSTRVIKELIARDSSLNTETKKALADAEKIDDKVTDRLARSGQKRRNRRIVNGTGTFAFPAAGALLIGQDRGTARIGCSGTLVGCNKFLTAAHCVYADPSPRKYKVFFQNFGFVNVINIQWPPSYKGPNDPVADVAILTLEKSIEGVSPIAVNRIAEPPVGTEATIVGFGRTGGVNNDYGIKRRGFARTAACRSSLPKDALVCWNFDALGNSKFANTCNVDSGGGLYVDQNTNRLNNPVIIGSTIAGTREDCLQGDHSYDANLYSYQKWITDAGVTDKTENCGNFEVDTNKNVVGSIDLISASKPEIVHSVEVSAEIARFSVAMNAEDNGEGKNDFDLHVIEGSGADITRGACTETGGGQFAFCDVPNPRAGTWTIVVKRKRGEGLAQITVTQLPK